MTRFANQSDPESPRDKAIDNLALAVGALTDKVDALRERVEYLVSLVGPALTDKVDALRERVEYLVSLVGPAPADAPAAAPAAPQP